MSKNVDHINKTLTRLKKEVNAIQRKGTIREVGKNNSTQISKRIKEISECINYAVKSDALQYSSMRDKFFTTLGIEYTFLQRVNSKKKDYDVAEKIMKSADKRQVWNKRVHPDGEHVIEIASPVHKNWENLLKHYRIIKANARKHNLVYKRQDCTGGGAHIHMGLPKKWSIEFKLRFLRNFYSDIAFRPYINWFFNDSLDDINANSMFTSESSCKIILQILEPSYFNVEGQHSRNSCILDIGLLSNLYTKDYAIRYDSEYDTVELRVFRMVENERMLEDYVKFANAYFLYIYNQTKDNYGYKYEIDVYDEYATKESNHYLVIKNNLFDRFKNKKYTTKRFLEFIESLGLKPSRYKKYIKNYEARLECYKNKEVKMDFDMIKSFTWPSRTYIGENNLDGGIGFKTTSSDLGNIGGEGVQETSINIETSPEFLLSEDSIEISENIVTETIREVANETVTENEAAFESCGEENRSQEWTQPVLREISQLDPIQKLNSITKLLTSEVVSQLTSTPRRGQKITIKVSTTW